MALKQSLFGYFGAKVSTIWAHGPLGNHSNRGSANTSSLRCTMTSNAVKCYGFDSDDDDDDDGDCDDDDDAVADDGRY